MKRPEKSFIRNIILVEIGIAVQPLKETVHRYKNTPEEVAVMCAELEKWSLEERQEGENRLTTLLRLLKADGRLQDLELAIDDEKAREKLYEEYHIS